MDPSQQRLQELFLRYLRGRCEPQEVAELVTLLETADAADALTEPMLRLWEELKVSRVEYPVDWDRMYARVSQAEEDLSTLHRRRVGMVTWRAAAAVLLIIMAGTAIYWGMDRHRSVEVVENRPVTPAPVVAEVAANKSTARHIEAIEKKRVVRLPDGSMVLLNKHTTLEYTGGDSTREVTLSGEGYFNIVHRPGKPFIVHTGKIETTVLGTAFNIKAYPAETAIEVTVDHGKVRVMRGQSKLGLLTDNQQIRYDKGTEGYIWQRVNVKPVIAWKPQEVSFDDITMEEAARRIGQRFHVTVVFNNPVVKQCRVTATFYEEDDLDQIMTVICAVSQASFVIKGDAITIDGKGCNE